MSIVVRGQEKTLHLFVENEGLRLFLGALLTEWKFTVLAGPNKAPEVLALADDNYTVADENEALIRLTRSSYAGRDRLCLPLALDELWSTLEKHFHRPPRHHLRLAVAYPATMELRGQTMTAQVTSISPAGARLPLPRELAAGETFALSLHLPRHTLALTARTIYVNTFPDRHNHYETGILFERIDAATKQILRDTITLAFLEAIRPKLPSWAFTVGLDACKLSPELRAAL